MHRFFLLGLVASTALYGIVALAACVFALHVGFSAIMEAAGGGGVEGAFCTFMTISLIAYPLLMTVHILMVKASHKVHGSTWPIGPEVPSWFVADFTNPFRGLRALRGARQFSWRSWASEGLHFVWSVLLWGWMAIGIAAVGRG